MTRTFVLVHGAWHGGWCWRRLADELRKLGHAAWAPTLTGLGERSHLATPCIGFDHHVQDIHALLECEELTDVVLVGHSYGGQIIQRLAVELPQRIRRLVFLDGVILQNGENLWEQFSPEHQEALRELLRDGFLGHPAAAAFGIDPADTAAAALLERHLRPQPFKSMTDRMRLDGDEWAQLPGSYIHCTANPSYITQRSARRAREHGWPVHELLAGHDPMITMPVELAALLSADAAC